MFMRMTQVTQARIRVVWAALLLAVAAVPSQGASPERWGLWETELKGPDTGNPYAEVTFGATFSRDGRVIEVPGFWDGGNVYRLRFSPPAEGEWRYVTRSNRPELDGQRGAFTAVAATGDNHGPVEVFKTFYFRYADGTPYHPFGTTCYAWVHQTEDLQEQTLKTLAASPFNKIRFCVFPKNYTYNQNEPPNFAFVKKADGSFDFSRPDPAFWHPFEVRILDLQRLGIEADLILWHPYDRWGFSKMSKEEDDRYLRYCIARLSAFRNVWWSLANEYDFMTKPHTNSNKDMSDWDRFFGILEKEDPFHRLRGIHNGSIWYDHTKVWVTHASIQNSDMNKGVVYRAKYQKPVVYDECKYEGNVPQGWGNLDARTMTQRFWLGTLSGCTVGHGETYLDPNDVLWWSKGGVLHGESPRRIQWLKDFIAGAPPFEDLQPLGDEKGRYLLAKPGTYYLLYALNTQPQSLALAGDRPYKVDRIDPWEMTVTPLGSAPAGEVSFKPPKSDQAYRFTPYAPGEQLRPEAKIEASVTEGLLPLSVRFHAAGEAKARWDFGDGAASGELAPTHVFTRSGLYTVTLTVTDAAGGCAQSSREVLVEDTVLKPLVRAGCAGETPELALGGTARRTDDGALLFPDGAPWGWASGPRAEALRGLRTFTVTGWLKPASLAAGQGGNRILFCLNRDTDGIDLVCHSDGCLRLAVNQWPDKVNNDSAPGRLVPGKWTFFAVTYDSTLPHDNVRWFFSAPLDTPDAAAGVTLDRTNTYAVGPIGTDIGSLAVGNFNETMRGAGLDRQFRGEIRNLQLCGTRVGNAGALDLTGIRRNLSCAK